MSALEDFDKLEIGAIVLDSDKTILVAVMQSQISAMIGIEHCSVVIPRKSLKHIVERRGNKARFIIEHMPIVIKDPVIVSDNSKKRQGSFIFAIPYERWAVGIIITRTKTPGVCRVVSAFPIELKTYRKLTNISGRAEFPPFELPS